MPRGRPDDQEDRGTDLDGRDACPEQAVGSVAGQPVVERARPGLPGVDLAEEGGAEQHGVSESKSLGGRLHSVNPVALAYRGDIPCTNERQIHLLETENFGRLAYIEIGALNDQLEKIYTDLLAA